MNGVLAVSFVTVFFVSLTAQANDQQSGEEQNQAPTVLVGRTQERRPKECRLYVHRHGYVESGQLQFYEALVTTNDAHEGDTHEMMTARQSASNPHVLEGQNPTQTDRIAIFLPVDQQAPDVTRAHSYNLVWRHGSHNHTTRCRNMVKQAPVQQNPAESQTQP